MSLVVVVVGLIIWGIIALKEAMRPPAPPVEDWNKHLQHLLSLPDEKARQKYLKNRKPGDK